jgi:hypothetical protein
LLGHHDIAVIVPCLRTLGNIATGSEEDTQNLINEGILTKASGIMFHHKKMVRKEVCWTLSNITAGTANQI